MTKKVITKRFPIEKFLIMFVVIGLFITVIVVSANFYLNPPGGERESMFVDDPNMTNNPAATISLQKKNQENNLPIILKQK